MGTQTIERDVSWYVFSFYYKKNKRINILRIADGLTSSAHQLFEEGIVSSQNGGVVEVGYCLEFRRIFPCS